jgi:hypothetical protein
MMKKTILLILLTTLLQEIYSQRWEHVYGNPNSSESFRDVIESYDKGYIISSSYESPQANWIFKTDINGNILWEKLLTWENTTVYNGYVKQDEDGNIIIASNIYSEENGFWPLMIKLDSCGEKVWCRVFPKYDYDFGYYQDVLILNNGDYLALGLFLKDNLDRVHLDYVDKDGNLLWRKAYAKEEDHPLIASPGGRNLNRFNNDYYINGWCYWPYPNNPSHVYLRPMFIAIDSMFNEKWLIPFGVSDSILGEAYDFINVNDSIFFGVGSYILPGKNGISQNSLLMLFNKDGEELGFNLIKNEQIGPEVTDNSIHDIVRINDSLYMALAKFGNEENYSFGEFVIDTASNLYNHQSRPNTEGYQELIKTYDSNYLIGIGLIEGKIDWDVLIYKINENLESVPFDTNQYTYDSLCPHQIQSGTIDLSDCLIWTDIGEIPTPEEYCAKLKTIPIKVFPNPAKENITFGFENTKYHQNMQLQCFDVFGRKVHKEIIYTGQLETEINVSQWNEGLYVAVVMSEGKVLGKVKFMVLR